MCAVQQTPQRSTGSLTWVWAAETDAADTQSIAAIARITTKKRTTKKRIERESERSILLLVEDITTSKVADYPCRMVHL
jgi:hypothetical protein